jgi:hypothetical protein
MRLELDTEEAHQLFTVVVDRVIEGVRFSAADKATLRRWRSESMRPASEGMKELAAKLNADIDRTLQTRAKSAVRKPDWK